MVKELIEKRIARVVPDLEKKLAEEAKAKSSGN
jgi:hypothetical protein